MKLSEHVDKLRTFIEGAFDNQLVRLGFGKSRVSDIDRLPEEIRPKRQKIEIVLKNHVNETGDYESGREKLIDELTFTLFNRLAAIKVMEAANLFPPILTKHPEHGNRSFGHKQWLEIRPDMRNEELDGIREYIKYAFDELGESLPLYNRSYPYALLPDTIRLNEIIDAFNAVEKDGQIGNEIWQNYDVMGWMYESYNNAKKAAFKDSGKKVEYNKVSLQSQVYTPRWVVQFLVENSLGKLYLEMYPDSKIKDRYKIANAPNVRIRELKPLKDLKLIDPACGSGNFLLYAFDFFYELYLDQIENYGADYNEADIPKLIIENNLHGIDLDDRAVQLAQLGLFIKAKKKQRTIGELKFKIVSSDFFLPEYKEVQEVFESLGTNGYQLDENQKELIRSIWSDLQYAYKFGSLIRVGERLNAKLKDLEAKQASKQQRLIPYLEIEEHKVFASDFFKNLKIAVEQYAKTEGNSFLTSKTRDAITFLELLTTEYDVATTNPPYTDSSDFGPELKKFIDDNYKKPYKFHTNLYATFIKRCYEMTGEDGKIAMIHPRTFMFIKTFEDVRNFMLEKTHINVFVDYSLSNLFGAIMVDPAFYILEKTSSKGHDAWFVSLDRYTRTPNERFKKDFCLQALNDYTAGVDNEHNYIIPQSKLKIIKSWPFIYWISDELREKFELKTIGDALKLCSGLGTGDNNRFLRFWWELNIKTISEYKNEKKWFLYAKGGPSNKWYGNLWLVVNWENNGYEIKNLVDEKGKQLSRPQNQKYYFNEGISFVKAGTKTPSFRYIPNNSIFDSSSPAIFPKNYKNLNYTIAFLNSKLSSYILDCLNPTAGMQVGDVERTPLVVPKLVEEKEITKYAIKNISIKKKLYTYSLVEQNYSQNPLSVFSENILQQRIFNYFNYENHLLAQVLINEAIINEKIFEVYDLTEHDKAMVLAKEGESIGGLPVSTEACVAYLAEEDATSEFPLDNIREFIESLPVKEFTTEERDIIERGFPSLYQNNNDLEEFCISHKVNPINVWYWFKQSNVVPQQRMHTLAMEFLADMIREILMEDKDGIIPLVPNAGEKVMLDRIEQKFREKGFSMAQYSSFDSLLGRPINEYLNKYFFAELSDYLNLFMYLPKTPFIWHLSSGPEQGFDCYIIIYEWSRDKLMMLRSVYIEHRERSLVNRQSDLANNNSLEAQTERDLISKQLREIEAFKVKIDELLSEGYDPILDDGVGKNIAPLQKKKMIPYDVLNEGQLKKYLNADW